VGFRNGGDDHVESAARPAGGSPTRHLPRLVWWNSTYMADAVDHLRATGDPAPNDLLAHTSPVGWEHIAFSGDFLWDRAAAIPVGRRELVLGRRVRGAA
jgi:hypothetical protein